MELLQVSLQLFQQVDKLLRPQGQQEQQEHLQHFHAGVVGYVTAYMVYLNKISDYIETTDKKLKEIDAKGSFESDDEIGFFFKQIQNIQTVLNSFNIKNL